MAQEEALLPAPATMASSWEDEQGVLKHVSAPAVDAHGMAESPRKAPAAVFLPWEHEPAVEKPSLTPAVKPRAVPEGPKKTQAPTRRLSVPPPPGRQAWRGAASRAVGPEDDPFLAAYLACTKSTGGRGGDGKKRPTKGQRPFAWARLGLGGLSCKRDDGGVAQSMVRLAKLPELDTRDA